jgi:hypothetical protein
VKITSTASRQRRQWRHRCRADSGSIGESRDDPNTTGKDEMFDVLWGRWPRFSELYIYSYPMENSGKVAQLNNLLRMGTSWSLVPVKGMTCSLTYNAWFAPENVPTRTLNPALFSRSENFRGHFVQLVLRRQFSKHLSGHLLDECLWQGTISPGATC